MTRFGPLILAALLGVACAAGPARADDPVALPRPVVVELFTSQGCSSCPPADALLGELAGRPDVLALSLHVDYWDYLGWRDTFASAWNTKRQFAYRDWFGGRVVYTPQMVIDGATDAPGSRRDEVLGAIEAARALHDDAVSVTLEGEVGMRTARISRAQGPRTRSARLWVVLYRQRAEVEIARGENRGRTIAYSHVVEAMLDGGLWEDAAPREVSLPKPEAGQGLALLVQEQATGRIVGAARVD